MRIVLFCENKYAIDILYPIYQEALKSEDNQLLWYIHLPKIPVFPLQKEVTYTNAFVCFCKIQNNIINFLF